MFVFAVGSEVFFEASDGGAEDQGLRIADLIDGQSDFFSERGVLGLEVEQLHFHDGKIKTWRVKSKKGGGLPIADFQLPIGRGGACDCFSSNRQLEIWQSAMFSSASLWPRCNSHVDKD